MKDNPQPEFSVVSIKGNDIKVQHFECTCGEPVGRGIAQTGSLDGTIDCPGCGKSWKPQMNITWEDVSDD